MNTTSSGNGNVKGSAKDSGSVAGRKGVKSVDEDVLWAEEDPDEDVKGWKMRVSKAAADLGDELGV